MGKYLKGDVVPCGGEWCEFMVMLTDHEWRHVDTHGHELGHEPIPRRNRTGPYRLLDGTWSDGVDRTKRILYRQITSHYEVTASHHGGGIVWQADRHMYGKSFETWVEAIAYADHLARTNQGENND